MDWFSRVGLLLIVVVLIALMVYSRSKRTPTVYGNTQEPALIEFME